MIKTTDADAAEKTAQAQDGHGGRDMITTTDAWLTVNDLKQYAYCPRVIFYRHCLPLPGRPTYKMVEGQTRQDEVSRLERRRTLHRYGLESAERRFDLPVRSDALRLSGRIDMALIGADLAVPVDFKSTEGPGAANWRLQLVAYTLLLEERFERPSPFGLLYLLGSNRVERVPSDAVARAAAHTAMAAVREVIAHELMPAATPIRGRCRDCEYRRYCNDVW